MSETKDPRENSLHNGRTLGTLGEKLINFMIVIPSIPVIYVIGVGHSGSTVLDTVLGNHPQIESVGELINLPRSGWTNADYCACGQPGNECQFWSAVHEAWCQLVDDGDVVKYIALAERFERFRDWPRLIAVRRNPSREFQKYALRTQSLFRAIQNTGGQPIIVDSSKHPVRAYALSLVPGIDLSVIHLVRDARGVAYSNKKAFKKDLVKGLQRDKHPQPAWRSAFLCLERNLQAEWVRKEISPNRSMLVRYEDFMTNPVSTIKRICDLVEIDSKPLIQQVLDKEYSYDVGHTIAGNRLRMAGNMKLRFDEAWKTRLSHRDRRTVEVLTGWLMLRYGYNN